MKKVLSLLLVCAMILSLAACSKDEPKAEPKAETKTETKAETKTEAKAETKTETANNTVGEIKQEVEATVEAIEDIDEINVLTNGALVDGKFPETKKIKVEVYDRSGAVEAADNMYTDYIKKGVLDQYNIEVEYVPVSRWEEVNILNSLLAAQDAPDLCYTYDWATIQAYADMGGILDLQEWTTDDFKGLFPNLWNTLGSAGINFRKNPDNGEVLAIEGVRKAVNKSNTFIREDWLKKLNLAVPTTTAEFEAVLKAFKDNAEILCPGEADKVIPFTLSTDVGWRASTLIESMMDVNITDKELFRTGFDDRHYLNDTTKEAVRLLNKWYNEGLIWNDFALYDDEEFEDDMMKAGYVGAFVHNYDYPFRNGEDSFNYTLSQVVGADARFIAINPFDSTDGTHTQYLYNGAGTDRKIFMPATCSEPLACLLYLDWISNPANTDFLQIGVEGITHVKNADGSVTVMAPDEDHTANTIVSLYNIDYTMTINGLALSDPEVTNKSLALAYANNDPQVVADAIAASLVDGRTPKNYNLGTIESESGAGNALKTIRDEAYCKAVTCAVADFDATWDAGMDKYLSQGGQDIIDERVEKWEAAYGTAANID